ncbi:MAG: PP2C family protein-serine/threonine phosphatase [Acidimicrobiales bacterium]
MVATIAAWLTHITVANQEHRLLAERAREVALVLTTDVSAIPDSLTSLGQGLQATGHSVEAFDRAAAAEIASGAATSTFAWMVPSQQGFIVVAAEGTALKAGQVVTGTRAAVFDQALLTTGLVPTPVRGTGALRTLGFALGPPAAPPGTVLYRQEALGPVSPPRQAATAPFSEVDVVLYATPTVNLSQVLVATTTHLPLRHAVRLPVAAGTKRWLVSVAAARPLVGTLTAAAEWFVLGIGATVALSIALVIEAEVRRRQHALALYDSEHHIAETLQRSLLPTVPEIPGVEIAVRYLAGGEGQDVGGDWFDVFPITGGGVAVVIGDVLGHDLAAAAAMSQVRSGLRAYAWEGAEPATVLDRLARLVTTFSITPLVTVFYGIFEPPGAGGRRLLRFANAGHIPPLVRQPDGRATALIGGHSVVIGAPMSGARDQGEQYFDPGSTLLLFTDGLVETPGRPLTEALEHLRASLAGAPAQASAEEVCEELLRSVVPSELRDDVALLAIRMVGTPSEKSSPGQPQVTAASAPYEP